MKRIKKFEKFTSDDLWKLRKEINLLSYSDDDFENSFHLNAHDMFCFFDGYIDFLIETAEERGMRKTDYLTLDSKEMLREWWLCSDDYSWIRYN